MQKLKLTKLDSRNPSKTNLPPGKLAAHNPPISDNNANIASTLKVAIRP
ncbi:MAG: hypothetical protein ABSG33_09070 [Candidatus Bathyarchaeia archaeon]|jgi:hypothetical protein